jgi:hypothetical protein
MQGTFGGSFKNRIINGAMMIDQRNAGASVSNLDGYGVDRWYSSWTGGTGRVSAQQTTTAPAGFTNSWLLTVTATNASPASSDGNFFYQSIEGFNTADLSFGTASAQSITVSFWIRSSVTGTFPLILANAGRTRQFGATYTINSANTWEYKTVTVAGDTTGSWSTNNGIGITPIFGLSGGSSRTISTGWQTTSGFVCNVTGCTNFMANSGATLYITGVQLEKGSTATSFDYRPYGTELFLCQRYFEKSYDQSVKPFTAAANGYTTSTIGTNTMLSAQVHCSIFFAAEKRTSGPTMTCIGYSGGTSVVSNGSSGTDLAASSGLLNTRSSRQASFYNNAGSLATNSGAVIFHWTADAEL